MKTRNRRIPQIITKTQRKPELRHFSQGDGALSKIKKILLPVLLIALIVLTVMLWGFLTLLYIFGGLLLLILILLFVPIALDIKTKDGISVILKIAFVKIRLAPKKEKPVRLKDYRIRSFRRRRLKEQKEYLLKNKRAKPHKQKKASGGQEEKVPLKEKATGALDLVKNVILRAVKKFGKHLRIDVYRLRVFVGGSEPDKTALTYGVICQSVSYITKLLDSHLNVRYPGRVEHRIYVGADFINSETVCDIHIAFSIKVWQILSCAVSALIGYITMPKRKRNEENKDKNKIEMNPVKAGTEV